MKVAPLLCAAVLAGGLCAAAPPARAAWSQPVALRGCDAALRSSAGSPPPIVYPAASPALRSGPGMLLWSGPAGCGRRAGGTGAVVLGAPLGPTGLPGPGRALGGNGDGLSALAAATGTSAGQVLAIGAQADGDGAFVEGRTPGSISAPRSLGGPLQPVAAFSGYLGDAVLASLARAPQGRWALSLRVQRHYASGLTRLPPVALGARPTALTVTADYRAELLAVWASGGVLYARRISSAGKAGPPSPIASAPAGAGGAAWRPEIRALFSDDGRAIVAWRSQTPATAASATKTAAPTTTIAASISGRGSGFGEPIIVESYRDPRGLQPPAGSLRLTRMSSEAVMLAWTGLRAGRYVVRASPVSLRRGVWAPVTVSPPGPRQAMLAELVPGPRAEVLAVWSTAPRLPDGALDVRHRAILAAWGHYGGHGEALFAPAETLAPPGPNGTPAAAFDPADDRALAAWVRSGGSPQIVFAQRAPGPPAQAAPAQAAPARAASARVAPARAVSRRAASGAGDRGTLLTVLGLALLVVAAGAAYRGVGRRRGWIGARRAS